MNSKSQKKIHKPAQLSIRARKRTRLLTLLFGWVPLSVGIRLRSLAYRTVLSHLGHRVTIQPGVCISDGSCIDISDGVQVNSGTLLEAQDYNHIVLGSRVFIDRDVRISCTHGTGQVRLAESVSIDRGVDIKTHDRGNTTIGKHTYIGPYACLSGYGDITIGNNCLIASHASIYAHNYNITDPVIPIREQGYTYKGIAIEDNCWIGSGVRIVDGVTIGAGSVIGAGAVVTKSIPPNSVAVGTPAKVIRSRTETSIGQHSFENVVEAVS